MIFTYKVAIKKINNSNKTYYLAKLTNFKGNYVTGSSIFNTIRMSRNLLGFVILSKLDNHEALPKGYLLASLSKQVTINKQNIKESPSNFSILLSVNIPKFKHVFDESLIKVNN